MAKFLRFILPILHKPIPDVVTRASGAYSERSDELTKMLCDTLKPIPYSDLLDIVNSSRNPLSTHLLYWWLEHQEHDEICEMGISNEAKDVYHADVRLKYLDKLEERTYQSLCDYSEQKINR